MAQTHYEPNARIHPGDLRREKFGSAGIKRSTLRRLNLAREFLASTYESESYLILERSLEIYYHNTEVTYRGFRQNLLKLINDMEQSKIEEGLKHETHNKE